MDFSMIISFVTKLCIVSRFLPQVTAVQSDTCWDGTNAVDYTGTLATTSSGITCQSWANDSPHIHAFHGSSLIFPYDGDDVAAANFCRDPDGTSGTAGPWCFTMDPSARFEACNVSLCYNLPCTAGGQIAGQSNPSSFTTFLDTYTGINYLQKNVSPYGFTCCGTIRQWRVYIQNSGTIRFQAWRKDTGTGDYLLLGENVYSYASGDSNAQHDETVPQSERISVQEGDLLGWYTVASDMVSFSIGTTTQTALLSTTAPSSGGYVNFTAALIGNSRDYAIGAELTASLAPYFDNTITSISVSTAEAIGNTVHTFTVSDDDVDDISSLTISLATNTYFDISGKDLIVKSSLAAGTETLQLSVADQCSQSSTTTLTVTITLAVVSITSLPATANVSESITVETLVHTLTISPSGTYTCTLDAYEPTRAEGNPFISKINVTSGENGVYLKNAANIRYNVSTSYNVTVTCSNADPSSDTNYLIINVDPNSQPVFTSFLSSVTIDTATTNINDVVYNATVTDGDPITMSLTTDPSPSPFTINNDGEIRITTDPSLLTEAAYTFILTADDGFNAVTASNVSVTITNLNSKPLITNLPAPTQNVLENQAAGTLVYTVSQTDGNGDTPTFLATFSSTQCAGMYDINSSTGIITTLASFDYETDMSCTLTITVDDGLTTSDPETLVIDVGDEDEPPVLTSGAYVITTEEVAAGTVLPSIGISATDPEGTAVSFSLDCAYVDIDAATGVVTMTTAYDIETSPTDPYTISCTVTATDATSQIATATLDVIVSDGNDNAPVFAPAAYTFFITQGHTGYSVIDTVTATDADRTSPNNAFSYSVSPTTSFSIGANSGDIQNTVDLSGVAAGTTYILTVTATDGGTPLLSDTATVVISVLSTATVPTTAGATTTTTTTSEDDGFFSNTGSIILLAVAALCALLLSALLAFLLWMYCCRKASLLASKNHASRIGPGHPRFSQKVTSTSLNGQVVDPYFVSNAETQGPVQRQCMASPGESPRVSPVGSERPGSGESYISVASIPNRVSAVESIRRTNLFSQTVDSKRSTSNAVESVRRTNLLSQSIDSPRSVSAVESIRRANLFSQAVDSNRSTSNAVESVRRTNLLSQSIDSPRSVTNVPLHMLGTQTSKI